jgi:hypothetical protein
MVDPTWADLGHVGFAICSCLSFASMFGSAGRLMILGGFRCHFSKSGDGISGVYTQDTLRRSFTTTGGQAF